MHLRSVIVMVQKKERKMKLRTSVRLWFWSSTHFQKMNRSEREESEVRERWVQFHVRADLMYMFHVGWVGVRCHMRFGGSLVMCERAGRTRERVCLTKSCTEHTHSSTCYSWAGRCNPPGYGDVLKTVKKEQKKRNKKRVVWMIIIYDNNSFIIYIFLNKVNTISKKKNL